MSYQQLKFKEGSVFLVTGGAGFIGSNLCEALLQMGHTVRCLDDLSNGHIENIEPFQKNPNFTFLKQDIRDLYGGNQGRGLCAQPGGLGIGAQKH